MLELQDLLIWTKTKQMLLLPKNNTKTLDVNSFLEILRGKIDKRHHPIMLLRRDKSKNIKQTVVCWEGTKTKDINSYTNGYWALPLKSDVYELERGVELLSCKDPHQLMSATLQ